MIFFVLIGNSHYGQMNILIFWSQVSLRLKINQNLYRKMLRRNNWGHVWKDIPVNEKIIRPIWLQPLRFAAKVACAPFGRNTWHQIEKRFFNYWMDPVHNYAILPYYSALFEKSLARNAISLHTDAYLDFLNAKISSPLDKKNLICLWDCYQITNHL